MHDLIIAPRHPPANPHPIRPPSLPRSLAFSTIYIQFATATMSLQPFLYKQYTAIIARWPVDPLRPTLNFSEVLRARVTHYFGTHADADSTLPSQNTSAPAAKNPATRPQVEKFDADRVKGEINVLAALLEDRFMHKVS